VWLTPAVTTGVEDAEAVVVGAAQTSIDAITKVEAVMEIQRVVRRRVERADREFAAAGNENSVVRIIRAPLLNDMAKQFGASADSGRDRSSEDACAPACRS
jgi:hypothetical protein